MNELEGAQPMNEPRTTMRSRHHTDEEDRQPPGSGEGCVELPLLVSGWQWAALERAATGQGLTIGQWLRRLIAAHLTEGDKAWNPAGGQDHPEDSAAQTQETGCLLTGL